MLGPPVFYEHAHILGRPALASRLKVSVLIYFRSSSRAGWHWCRLCEPHRPVAAACSCIQGTTDENPLRFRETRSTGNFGGWSGRVVKPDVKEMPYGDDDGWRSGRKHDPSA